MGSNVKRVLAVVLVTLVVKCAPSSAASRETQWKEVEEAVKKGLPKTAIEKLEPIIRGALKEKAWGEATKAIARGIVFEGKIQGKKPEKKITGMKPKMTRQRMERVHMT